MRRIRGEKVRRVEKRRCWNGETDMVKRRRAESKRGMRELRDGSKTRRCAQRAKRRRHVPEPRRRDKTDGGDGADMGVGLDGAVTACDGRVRANYIHRSIRRRLRRRERARKWLRNVHRSVNAALRRIGLLDTRRSIRPLDACRSFGGILSRLAGYFGVIYSIGQRIADPSGGVRTIC